MKTFFRLFSGLALTAGLAACGNSDGNVTMAVGVPSTASSLTTQASASELVLSDGSHELRITSAELAIREIEFEQEESTAGCDVASSDDSGDDSSDDCHEFETGPTLLSVPLDGTVQQQLSATVPAGTYDEIEFEIRKIGDDTQAERDFVAAHPEFDKLSIVVTGTYDGRAFRYESRVDQEQEIELAEPLVIDGDNQEIGVTLTLDIRGWFVDGSGALVDPATANDGQPNESVVTENIARSIDMFHDDDHDGERHSDDDDED